MLFKSIVNSLKTGFDNWQDSYEQNRQSTIRRPEAEDRTMDTLRKADEFVSPVIKTIEGLYGYEEQFVGGVTRGVAQTLDALDFAQRNLKIEKKQKESGRPKLPLDQLFEEEPIIDLGKVIDPITEPLHSFADTLREQGRERLPDTPVTRFTGDVIGGIGQFAVPLQRSESSD